MVYIGWASCPGGPQNGPVRQSGCRREATVPSDRIGSEVQADGNHRWGGRVSSAARGWLYLAKMLRQDFLLDEMRHGKTADVGVRTPSSCAWPVAGTVRALTVIDALARQPVEIEACWWRRALNRRTYTVGASAWGSRRVCA